MPRLERFTITIVDSLDGGEHQVEVEVERRGEETLLDAAISIAEAAKKQYAASQVDHANFGSDSAYLRQRDQIVDRLTIGSFAKAGETTPFLVEALYSDDQSWFERIDAVDEEDANFSARWIMAANKGVGPEDGFDNLLNIMEEQTVLFCTPDPISFDEFVEMVRTHVSTQPNAPDFSSTREALIEALEKIDAARKATRAAQEVQKDVDERLGAENKRPSL